MTMIIKIYCMLSVEDLAMSETPNANTFFHPPPKSRNTSSIFLEQKPLLEESFSRINYNFISGFPVITLTLKIGQHMNLIQLGLPSTKRLHDFVLLGLLSTESLNDFVLLGLPSIIHLHNSVLLGLPSTKSLNDSVLLGLPPTKG